MAGVLRTGSFFTIRRINNVDYEIMNDHDKHNSEIEFRYTEVEDDDEDEI